MPGGAFFANKIVPLVGASAVRDVFAEVFAEVFVEVFAEVIEICDKPARPVRAVSKRRLKKRRLNE